MMRRVDLCDPKIEYGPDDPEGFGSGRMRVGVQLGAKQTGASLYELPPGQSLCPYHYEYGEEEWLLVVEGTASVRTPEGTEEVQPLELVFFPIGPDGAHEIRNDTEDRVRVLMWSTVVYPSATAYPDSGKVGVWTGDRSEDLMVERSSRVDYFHGESR